VRLAADATRVAIGANSTVSVIQQGQTLARLQLPAEQLVDVTRAEQFWQVGSQRIAPGEITLEPDGEGLLRLEKTRYRGRLRFVPRGPGKFDVVNDVDIESYLKGVVARELLWDWHFQAYRAQAVAARTYALYQARTRDSDASFDLHADTRSQVYGGVDGESSKAVDAVQTTRGLVLAYGPEGRERIFKAYFSSCCGGVTASVQDTFNEPVIEPLQSQYVGSLCSASPRYNWGPVTFSKSELTRRIRAYGARRNGPEQRIAAVVSIDIAAQNPHGRPSRFLVTDANGNRFSFTSEQMRWAINSDAGSGPTIPSGFFKPVNEPDAIRLVEGHGHGHGVGMCQWCTQARAAQGMRFDQILRLAYPGAILVRAY
jgi:stage II sporulation protein D